MKDFDDGILARVIDFNDEAEALMGRAIELEEVYATGELKELDRVEFTYADGRYVTANTTDHRVSWGGATNGINRLRLPEPGDYIVFDSFPLTSSWTYADEFFKACVQVSLEYYRIVVGDTYADPPATVWEGELDNRYNTRLTGSGPLPRELSDQMTIQYYYEDDVYDLDDESSIQVPGRWETVENQEEIWLRLVEASKRPRGSSSLPPALWGKVSA